MSCAKAGLPSPSVYFAVRRIPRGVGLAGKPSCDPRFIEVETKRNLKLEGASQSDANIRYDNNTYNEIND